MWPYASGRVLLPEGATRPMFVPQLPYLPARRPARRGVLPAAAGHVRGPTRSSRRCSMSRCRHLVIRLNETQDWAKVLSVGEQQRIAFARILLSRPRAVFLDESTSAMDEGLEQTLYRLLRAELPQTIVVSVSHRASVAPFHHRQPGTRRRRRMAAGATRRSAELRRGAVAQVAAVPCPNGNVHPDARLGQRARGPRCGGSPRAGPYAAVATMVVLVLIGRFTTWGQPVLARHPRLLHRPRERDRLGCGWPAFCCW